MPHLIWNIFATLSFPSNPVRRTWLSLMLLLSMGLSFIAAPCQASWVSSRYGMPFDAIAVRYQQSGYAINGASAFYLCRAYHNNDVQPGFTSRGDRFCHFGYGGWELISAVFDYWTPSWANDTGQGMPSNTIVMGGENTAIGSVYRYICRAGLNPGEYGADLYGCTYPYGGVEYESTQGFQWLVDSDSNAARPPGSEPADPITYNSTFGPYRTYQLGEFMVPDAIIAGIDTDGTTLYECTAFYQDGWQPGKTRADWKTCDIGTEGAEHYVGGQWYVLIPNYHLDLVNNVNDTVHCDDLQFVCKLKPIVVGRDTDGSPLYACTAWDYDGGLFHMGKTKAAWNGCSYAMNGVEKWSTNGFSVLSDGFIYPPGYVVSRNN